jgi:hypothetical protein
MSESRRANRARIQKHNDKVVGSFNKVVTRRRVVMAASQDVHRSGIKKAILNISIFIRDLLDGIRRFFRIGQPQPGPRQIKRPKDWHGTTRNGRHRGAFGRPQWMRDAGVKPFGCKK